MTRSTYNNLGGWAGGLFGVLSLVMAWIAASKHGPFTYEQIGKFLVGFWVLAPPVFLWVDWVWFWGGMGADEREAAKHTHDLSRNIWLALVAVLTVLFNIKVMGTGS